MSAPFYLCDEPLPRGTTVLEASAGTGKTYTLAGLVLRLVVEQDVPIGAVLVTTFTIPATAELRDRVRKRIAEAWEVFSGAETVDELLVALRQRVSRDKALERLEAALRDFDEATITTIHGFCHRLLREHALESGAPFAVELMPQTRPLMTQVAEDFWRRHCYEAPLPAALALVLGLSVGGFVKLLNDVLRRPLVKVVPGPGGLGAAMVEVRERLAEFRAAWAGERAAVVRVLSNEGGWAVKKLQEKFDPKNLIANLDTLAAGDEAPVAAYAGLAALNLEALQACAGKGKQAPVLEFYGVAGRFAEALGRYRIALEAEFIEWGARELEARKEQLGQMAFSDLLLRAHRALSGPGGAELAQAVRARYQAALVDEFQDTDPAQELIFRVLFGGGGAWLFLIGDPKQAIYTFRGADVWSYLEATKHATRHFTLGTNFRSSTALVGGVSAVFARHAAPFIERRIEFHPVQAAGRADERPLLVDGKARAPLRFWFLESERLDANGQPEPMSSREADGLLPLSVAGEIRRMLATATLGERKLLPADCAVLTRSHSEARAIQRALRRLEIPVVLQSQESVYASAEARDLRVLLTALAEPGREAAVRAALATDLLGQTAADLDRLAAEPTAWEAWLLRFDDYGRRWREQGFMAMFRAFVRGEGVRARLLGAQAGERRLTNLLHLAELLHTAALDFHFTPAALLRWLHAQLEEKPENEEAQLRLESDEQAVQVITIHKSKGLEYPVVFCPFLWRSADPFPNERCFFHDRDGRLTLDLTGAEASRLAAADEALAERLRLLYVALTRAKYECHVAFGAMAHPGRTAPVWLLENTQGKLAEAGWEPGGAAIRQTLEGLAAEQPERIAVMPLPEPAEERWAATSAPAAPAARVLRHAIPRGWRVSSFSSLIEGAESADSADRDRVLPRVDPAVPLTGIHALPRGARTGTCLHEILERWDFSRPELLPDIVEEQLAVHGLDGGYQGAVRGALLALSEAELEPGLQLRKITRGATLRELEFHFPTGNLSAGQLAAFTGAGLNFEARRGVVKGFIDLLFEHEGRFHFVDWKSNWLGPEAGAYSAEAMAGEMARNRYDLQWQIYAVALRRWLRLKFGDEADARLGRAFYVFLRGVAPERAELGVVAIAPELGRLEELERVFGGGRL